MDERKFHHSNSSTVWDGLGVTFHDSGGGSGGG